MAGVVPSHYNDANRAFLQSFMARGTLTFDQARPIIAAILSVKAESEGADEVTPNQVERDDFKAFLDDAGDALSKFDYEVRSTVHQITGQRLHAIVNTTSDPQTQLATTYTPDEMAFIRRVLDVMFDSHNRPRMEAMCITEMQAVKLARPSRTPPNNNNNTQAAAEDAVSDKGIKHSDVERVLDSLVDEGWFEKSAENFFSLSARGLMELRRWLVLSYNDTDLPPTEWQRIKFCEACRDIVTVGQRCSEVDCNVRLHEICMDAFWRSQPAKKCPRCQTAWEGNRFVGEMAVTSSKTYVRGRRRTGGGRRSTLADEALEEDEEEEEEGEEQQQQQNGSARENGVAHGDSNDEEEEEEEEDE